MLLSFAQFEREVTGERIRDKIAASKKKGMWMGGCVPLGYDVRDRKLQINTSEAETARTIFNVFLRLGNVGALKEWLDASDLRSKVRTDASGKDVGGNHFYRGPLYQMLRNPIYLGEIRHKKNIYPGEHEAILDRETWDKVQALLTENRQGNRRKARATKVSLLTGLLFDAEGHLYPPTHANKNGRRYRYYTSQAVIRKAAKSDVPTRIPAPDLESAVTDRILDLLRSPNEILSILADTDGPDHSGQFTQICPPANEASKGSKIFI